MVLCTGRFEAALAVRLQHMADAVVALEAIAPGAQLLQILPEPDTCTFSTSLRCSTFDRSIDCELRRLRLAPHTWKGQQGLLYMHL